MKSALPALEKVRGEGLVRAIGVGTNTAGAALQCVEAADLDFLMLAGICKEHGVELPTAAIQYPFGRPAVVNVTVGASRPEQISQSAESMTAKVPEELWQDLRERGTDQGMRYVAR